jgi:hypothetical protein
MAYKKLYNEFEASLKEYIELNGDQNIENIRILAKRFALGKRNNVNDLICRRYYWSLIMNYCHKQNDNPQFPEGFAIHNQFDPDGEFANDKNTQKAIKREENAIYAHINQIRYGRNPI